MIRLITILSLFAFVSSAAVLLPSAAQAEGACKKEAHKLCKDVKPGEGRIVKCLKGKYKNLPEPCKKHVKAEVRAACGKDVDSFCKGVKPGDGRLWKCLKKNREKLSQKCQNIL